jgi:hypothetical protein
MLCTKCSKEKDKDPYKWCEDCRSKQRKVMREWNAKNPEKHREKVRRWRKGNPEKKYAQSKRYKAKKKELEPTWYAFYTCRASARQRGIEFKLTREESDRLVTGDCVYCGATPDPTNGIDRIDSDVGYRSGNVVSCCADCNFAKRTRSVTDFARWVDAIAVRVSNWRDI